MPDRPPSCSTCGTPLSTADERCPVCGSPVAAPAPKPPAPRDPPPAPANGGSAASPPARAPENPFGAELSRRLARLAQWADASEPLDVALPRLPAWAEEAATHSRSPEQWAEVVRAVERLAQRRIAEAFDRWEERTSARIGRLQAYSVDSRLERSQVEDAVHAVRTGDIAQALASFQQVDRVVALKEHHLDQARGELEGLLAFLRDLEALGLVDRGEPAAVAAQLERELRTGQLAPLKRRLRVLRSRAVARLTESLPTQVAEVGDRIAAGPEARELAIAARAILDGHAEEGVRRLRALRGAHGLEEEPPPEGTDGTGAPPASP